VDIDEGFMNESETNKTIGIDGLAEFGEYLNRLDQPNYRDYTFEIPNEDGRPSECSLEDVLVKFREFFDGQTDTFAVSIGYVDYKFGTMGRSNRTFTRHKRNDKIPR